MVAASSAGRTERGGGGKLGGGGTAICNTLSLHECLALATPGGTKSFAAWP